MGILIYTGGEIRGYELEIGEKLTFISHHEYPYMGVMVKLHALRSLEQGCNVYVNTKELLECFQPID